jgi:WD40 repeat protein
VSHDDDAALESDVELPADRRNAVDEIGRRAGAALRRPAPSDGLARISRTANAQRVVRSGGVALVIVVIGAIGVVVVNHDDGDSPTPISTEITNPISTEGAPPPSVTSVAPSTPASVPVSVLTSTVPSTVPQTSDQALEGPVLSPPANDDGEVSFLGFSGDGAFVAVSTETDALQLLDAQTLDLERALSCPFVASAGVAGTVDVAWDDAVWATWDASTRSLLSTLPHGALAGSCPLALSSDAGRAATFVSFSDGVARTALIDPGDGSVIATVPGGSPMFTPDGALLLTQDAGSVGFADGSAEIPSTRVWSATDGSERPGGLTLTVLGVVTFSRDGTRFVAVDGVGSAHQSVWDLVTQRQLMEYAGGTTHDIELSPDGTLLALATIPAVTVIDVATGTKLFELGVHGSGDEIFSVSFSPDGTLIGTGGLGDEARIYDIETHEEVANLSDDAQVERIEFSPDGTTVLVVSSSGLRVTTVGTAEG